MLNRLRWHLMLGCAALAALAGAAVLWWSQDLMLWLISIVGEERALGARNVVRLDNDRVLLTNPGVMMLWTLPFLLLGFALLAFAIILGGLGYRRGGAAGMDRRG